MMSLEERFRRFCRTGDPDDLAAVYDATAPRLLRTALHLVGSASEAEDVLQAAFVVAIERRDSWDAARPLLPWLVGIVANQARLLRARTGRAPDPHRLAPEPSADPADDVTALEFTAAVDAAIDRLPEAYRAALVLHLRHGLPPADIAHALRRPPGTVRSQLQRGLEKLRTLLPAGLAGSLALMVHERGLAAVRTAVLGHAAATVPVVGAATTLLGILTMKKMLLVGAAVAALLCWSPWAAAPVAQTHDEVQAVLPAAADAPQARTAPAPTLAEPGTARTLVDVVPGQDRGSAPALIGPAIRGRAIWAGDGTPATNIIVWCRVGIASTPDRDETCTDADGRFAFAREPGTPYTIGGDRGGTVSVRSDAAPDAQIVLELPRGMHVRGRVVDDGGRPVANAALWLSDWNNREVGSIVAHTDHDGRYEVRGVGAKRCLGARAPSFVPSRLSFLDGDAEVELTRDFVLAAGGAGVSGRVFDTAGLPVPGATVHIAPTGVAPCTIGSSGLVFAWAPVRAKSDAQGRFEVSGLPVGRLAVQVRAPDHGCFATELDVPACTRAEVTAILPAAAVVVGRAVREDGTPLTSAMIKAGEWSAFAHTHAFVQYDGAFELRDVTPGAVALELAVDCATVVTEHVVLRAGETRTWNPVLRDRPRIDGIVVGDGAPMAATRVVAWCDRAWIAETSTDAAGRFAFGNLANAHYRIAVMASVRGECEAGFDAVTLAARDDVVPGSGLLRLEVAADRLPTCTLRGHLVEDDRTPVATARVWMSSMDGTSTVVVASVPDDGAFAVEGLVPGAYWLRVISEGHAELSVGRRELAPGQDLDVGALVLARGVAVHGELDLPPGAGTPSIEVFAAHTIVAHAQLDGRMFRTDLLGDGDYRLLVTGPGLAPTAVPFTVAQGATAPLRVAVAAGVRREIVATLPAGAAVPQWVLLTLFEGNEPHGGAALARGDDGTWRCELWTAVADCCVIVGTDANRFGGRAEIAAAATGPVRVELRARN